MKYYFCERKPCGNVFITEYDTLGELENEEAYYDYKNRKYFVIRGDIICNERGEEE